MLYDTPMNDFQTIMSKLKVLLSTVEQRILYDKELAAALNINPNTFASMRHRNTIPYQAVLDLCTKRHIDANTLFFSRPVNNLIHRPLLITYYKSVRASAGFGAEVSNEIYKKLTPSEFITLFYHKAAIQH